MPGRQDAAVLQPAAPLRPGIDPDVDPGRNQLTGEEDDLFVRIAAHGPSVRPGAGRRIGRKP